MLSVVCDGRPLQPGYKLHLERGIGRYAKHLLSEFYDLLGPEHLSVLVRDNLPDPELPLDIPRLAVGYAPGWLPIGKRLISEHLLSKRRLADAWRLGRPVHFFSHLDAPARPGSPTVVTVHDLIAQRLKHLYLEDKSPLRFNLERWLETRCLGRARAIIADSQATKRDVVELYGVDPAIIEVVYLAVSPQLRPVDDPARVAEVLGRHGLAGGEPFFFYVGGIDQRKDLGSLLEALAILREQGLAHRLALAGKIKQDKQYPKLRAAVERLGLQESVRELGFVEDQDLPALFTATAGFVYPSLYEGFGLPPLEAMACGAPVVAVGSSSVPEVVGDAGWLVPPGDAAALAEAMAALLTQPGAADDLRDRGRRRAASFSWQRAAQSVLAIYREVAGEP